jgi:predicted MFS family arabinose efflux permease
VLIGSIASTAVGWFVFAGATSIPMLFVGRILDGIAAGNISTAQSTLVDISKDDRERTQNLGLLGAAFGIGFMLGPIIGGALSTVSHAFPFWCAGGLATINAIVAYTFLPETHHDLNTSGRLSVNPLVPMLRALRDTKLRPLYVSWVMFMMFFVTSQAVFALFVEKVFAFDSFETGLAFTAMGLLVALNQTVGLKYFWLRRFTEARLELMMFVSLLIGTLLFITRDFWLFVLSTLFISTGQSVLRVVLTSQVAGQADSRTKGEKIGTLTSLMSACMALAPLIAGPLFELDMSLPYYVATGYLLVGMFFTLRYQAIARRTHTPIPESTPVV